MAVRNTAMGNTGFCLTELISLGCMCYMSERDSYKRTENPDPISQKCNRMKVILLVEGYSGRSWSDNMSWYGWMKDGICMQHCWKTSAELFRFRRSTVPIRYEAEVINDSKESTVTAWVNGVEMEGRCATCGSMILEVCWCRSEVSLFYSSGSLGDFSGRGLELIYL